jgi:hypothetical protein
VNLGERGAKETAMHRPPHQPVPARHPTGVPVIGPGSTPAPGFARLVGAPASSVRPAAPRLTILSAAGRDVLGLWQNVLVTYWHDPPTLERLRQVSEVQSRVAERLTGGFVVLAMLPTVPVRIQAAVRDEAEQMVARTPASLRAMAYVVGGSGFVAASVRSVALSVIMVLPHKRPIRVFTALEPAAGWVSTFLGRDDFDGPHAANLKAAAPRLLIEAIRDAIA